MTLFQLFCQINQREIISCFRRQGPVFRIIPREPLGSVTFDGSLMPDGVVTVVMLSCAVDHGTLRVEAYSEADLAVAEHWAEKHKNTPPEDFTWLPSFEEST